MGHALLGRQAGWVWRNPRATVPPLVLALVGVVVWFGPPGEPRRGDQSVPPRAYVCGRGERLVRRTPPPPAPPPVLARVGALGWFARPGEPRRDAQSVPPRVYVCGRADGPPAFEGRLDEGAWKAAAWTDDFVDIEGDR